jgi:hypothetical protein
MGNLAKNFFLLPTPTSLYKSNFEKKEKIIL